MLFGKWGKPACIHLARSLWAGVAASVAYPSSLGFLEELLAHVTRVFPLSCWWVSDSWWGREVGPARMYKYRF